MARAFLLGLAEEQRQMNVLRRERRTRRALSDPMNLPDQEFVAHFRLSKEVFNSLAEELRPYMRQQRRNTGVLSAVSFYAQRSYQKSVGSSYLFNMSQPSFSRCLHKVTNALNHPEILTKYIKFPFTREERENIMAKFMEKFGFPGTIGCIDGTHVALIRPVEHEETYYNRKNYHSLNVLIICDSQLNIIYADASFGGAAHDSFIWNQSPIKDYMQELHNNGERCWLLGDSGYAQRPHMMTPILGAAPGTPEEHYTALHCRVRNTVERCTGVLKARWRCLLAHRVLHYDPIMSGKIVNACIVLHNIANASRIALPELPIAEMDNDQQRQPIAAVRATPDDARDSLVNRLWRER
ncbi:hypothetical protein ABMA27_010319 [Loxostege sticticalis]|uniref:DDE Tnp4 domain-containing protein n=1 Tax=Loxostege sticticalis TaxID=481309 RepID=A0ABR3H5D4_LOXSC